jgi:hypothetical protein
LLISANIVQYQQSPALGMPCLGGGDLLLGRFGYKPKLELRLELGRDFGNRTLAAKVKHYRIERTLYRVFFSDLTREPLQYLIRSLFSFHL